ncbi:MAG: M6 family metalloprotease domain-containing protein [Bacteroidales bacterium]|nr:M6 family metalloprotease domain-containing protein [Bacteroidales bacterium]
MAFAFLSFLAAGICLAATAVAFRKDFLTQNIHTIPVLLVEFSDTGFTLNNPTEMFHNQLNGNGYSHNGAQGCAAEYFNTNFQGTARFEFPIAAQVSLDTTIATYGAHSATFNDTDVTQLLLDACTAAQAQGTDFSLFDPDNNGTIENIAIIFAGYSESEGASADAIWAHQKTLPDEQITICGLQVLSYTCTPELKGNSGTEISSIGTFCHEIAHSLGLPDMYDTNSDTEGLSTALCGTLSLMDKGNASGDGNTPPYFTSIEREILGIGEVEDLVPGKEYTLEPVNLSGKIYRIKCASEGEYYLLECRHPEGWDKHIGGGGLVLYHIDKSESVHGGFSCAERWSFNNINCFAEHPCAVALIPSAGDVGTTSPFFPGVCKITGLNSENPAARLADWNGEGTGIALTEICYSNGTVRFRTLEDYFPCSSLPKAMECKVAAYQNDARIEWTSVLPAQDGPQMTWRVRWQEKGAQEYSSTIADNTTVYLSDLQPGTQYNVEIRCMRGMQLGQPMEIKVKTQQTSSDFPYIHIGHEELGVGDKMDLRIMNLPSDCIGVEWKFGGTGVSSDILILESSGTAILEAILKYSDGSEEHIYKKITVE